MPRRMRAAMASLPFEHPKLSVQANIGFDLAKRMEATMALRGRGPVIDAKPREARRRCSYFESDSRDLRRI